MCTSVAYPYGDVDARVVAAAAAAGYRAGAALPKQWPATPYDPLEHPRVGIWHRDRRPRFALKTSPLVRRARVAVQQRWRRAERP